MTDYTEELDKGHDASDAESFINDLEMVSINNFSGC